MTVYTQQTDTRRVTTNWHYTSDHITQQTDIRQVTVYTQQTDIRRVTAYTQQADIRRVTIYTQLTLDEWPYTRNKLAFYKLPSGDLRKFDDRLFNLCRWSGDVNECFEEAGPVLVPVRHSSLEVGHWKSRPRERQVEYSYMVLVVLVRHRKSRS